MVSCDTPPTTQIALTKSPIVTPSTTFIAPTQTPTLSPTFELLTQRPSTNITQEKQGLDDALQKLKPTIISTKRPTEILQPEYRWVNGSEIASEGNIYITIDDCAQEKPLKRIVQLLITHGLRATFFPNTDYILNQDPQLWKDITSIGQIGYHTTDHKSSFKNPKSIEELERDYTTFQKVILQKTGLPVEVERAPFGEWTPSLIELAKRHNLLLIQWTIAPTDFGWEVVENKLKNNGRGGGILLFHATDKDADYLEATIARFEAMQFNGKPAQFPTVNQVFR